VIVRTKKNRHTCRASEIKTKLFLFRRRLRQSKLKVAMMISKLKLKYDLDIYT